MNPKYVLNVCDNSGRYLVPADPDEDGPDVLVVYYDFWEEDEAPRRSGRRRRRIRQGDAP